jgi:hypothetical protein
MPKPGKHKVYVAIAKGNKLLSGLWRIWSHKQDVYVAIRSLGGTFKTSLHLAGAPNRAFRSAFVTEAQSARFRGPGDRVVRAWQRPSAQVPGGVLLCQIIFPDSTLASYLPKYEVPDGLVRLSPPPERHATYVSIVQTELGIATKGPQFADRPTDVLASWPLPDGSTLWVVVHNARMTESSMGVIERARTDMRERVTAQQLEDSPGAPASELRAFFELNSPDGVARMLDISAEFLRRSAGTPT